MAIESGGFALGDSRFIGFVERNERNHEPHPGLWLFTSVMFGIFAVAAIVAFTVLALTRPAKAGEDWALPILAVLWAIMVPLNLWRMNRDRRRQASWKNPGTT